MSESLSSLGVDGPITPEIPNSPPAIPIPPVQTTGPFSLSVAKAGSGSVSSSPAGIDCGGDCSESFANGTSVTLTATSGAGYVFKGWNGACSGTSLTCTVSMSMVRNVAVNFEPANGSQLSIASIIASMPANSWKSLPNTMMKDVCPTPYNSYACEAVVSAWSGGDYDLKRDRMIIIGGGHNDSWYNNVFTFNLNSMQWQRLSEMPANAGGVAPAGWRDIRLETCGYYPKSADINIPADFMKGSYVDPAKCFTEPVLSQLDFQQPRSTHTYGRVFHDRANDRYCYFSLGTFPSAQSETKVVPCFDPVAGQWVRMTDRPSLVGGRGQTAVDSKNKVWVVTPGSGPIGAFDTVANSWSTYGYLNADGAGSMDIDRTRDQLYVLFPSDSNQYTLRKFNINSTTDLAGKPPYANITTMGDAPKNLGPRPGFVYADAKDKFFVWGGGRDVYALDPKTASWQRHSASGDDPGVQSQWGSYGRFRYSSNHGVFVLVNSTKQNVFIYKP